MIDKDPPLSPQEQRELELLQRELRVMTDAAFAARKTSTWMAIESEARRIALAHQEKSERRENFWQWIGSLITPRAVAPVFVPVVALLALVLVNSRSGLDNSGSAQLAALNGGASAGVTSVALTPEQMDGYLKRMADRSFAIDRRPVLAVSNVAENDYKSRFLVRDENDLHVRFASSMIDRDFILGGLRTKGADIEEVSSERLVNILPSADEEAPPIVWVANAAPAFGVSGVHAHGISPDEVN